MYGALLAQQVATHAQLVVMMPQLVVMMPARVPEQHKVPTTGEQPRPPAEVPMGSADPGFAPGSVPRETLYPYQMMPTDTAAAQAFQEMMQQIMLQQVMRCPRISSDGRCFVLS